MNIQYHTYTVTDVRAWLYEGADNGLSEKVISKVRANAILCNPYLKDDMVIVVSATDEDKLVGFTSMFPEHLMRPDIWLSVPSTLYANPNYAGEFIGYYVSKALHDTSDGRLVIGSDLVKEAVMIDKLLGLKADKFPRKRIILRRSIHWDTMRHVLSSFYEPVRLWKQKCNIRRVLNTIPKELQLEYTNFVDAEMYDFIVRNSDNVMFVRSREMLNWIVSCSFGVEAPLYWYVKGQNKFASQTPFRMRNLFKVYLANKLIGVCMIAANKEEVNIRLLYTDSIHKNKVFAILLQHVIHSSSKTLWSLYPDFNDYVIKEGVALKIYNESLVFTHPESLVLEQTKQLQGADGDMFI